MSSNAEGQNNLGICYQWGIGVEKDVIKANEYYNKSAKQGNQEAKNNYENLTYRLFTMPHHWYWG